MTIMTTISNIPTINDDDDGADKKNINDADGNDDERNNEENFRDDANVGKDNSSEGDDICYEEHDNDENYGNNGDDYGLSIDAAIAATTFNGGDKKY
jgi:hypothetical protein